MNWPHTIKASLLCVVVATSVGAQAGTTSVNTLNNLFLSGGNVGIGGGLTPTAITLNAGTNRVLTISSATGSAAFCPGNTCIGTPEGGSINGTNINSSGSIAGIIAPSPASGFLAGLFLGAALPVSAPSRLDFTGGLNFATLSPALGQIFFIGDGRTSAALIQQFFAPDAATRLYFGVADAGGFVGDPGFYFDNVGSYSVTYAVTALSTIPEPATVVLFGSGAVVLALLRLRRRYR